MDWKHSGWINTFITCKLEFPIIIKWNIHRTACSSCWGSLAKIWNVDFIFVKLQAAGMNRSQRPPSPGSTGTCAEPCFCRWEALTSLGEIHPRGICFFKLYCSRDVPEHCRAFNLHQKMRWRGWKGDGGTLSVRHSDYMEHLSCWICFWRPVDYKNKVLLFWGHDVYNKAERETSLASAVTCNPIQDQPKHNTPSHLKRGSALPFNFQRELKENCH